MEKANCANCGLRIMAENEERCHLTGQATTVQRTKECKSFIEVQMDGDEPFTPEQHLMMKKDLNDRQGMKKVQGMKF